jgi:hypothetical protein
MDTTLLIRLAGAAHFISLTAMFYAPINLSSSNAPTTSPRT